MTKWPMKPLQPPKKRNMQDAYLSLYQALKKQVVALEKRVAQLEANRGQ